MVSAVVDFMLRNSKPNKRNGTLMLRQRTDQYTTVYKGDKDLKICNQEILFRSTIEYVELCYEDIHSVLIYSLIGVGLQVARLLRESKRDELKLPRKDKEPTRVHRFIHFRASSGNGKTVYGIIEHFACGAMCHLKIIRNNDTAGTVTGIRNEESKVYKKYASKPTVQVSIWDLFSCAWKRPYCLRDNNCIHYAVRCWNCLKPIDHPQIKYEDVYQVNEPT